MDKHILFVGGGNMGRALIGGLLATGVSNDLVSVVDPEASIRAALETDFDVTTMADLEELERVAEIVVLAVKPQIMAAVVPALNTVVAAGKSLVVSIVAGVTTERIAGWLQPRAAIVRVMPNTPALIGKGAAAMFANDHVSARGRADAAEILEAVGIAEWVEEEALIDAVTAISGSGPAYFFLLFEAMINNAVALGLDRDMARRLTLQTGLGAAELARRSETGPEVLRAQVTSPGGTTEHAINTLLDGGFETLFGAAMRGAYKRARELGRAGGEA
jgi:pyrroline-5-carboxylate reductase